MARLTVSGPRRWLGYAALVVVFSVVCGLLSWWQFARNEEAAERIRQVVDNWDTAPVALGDLLQTPEAVFDPAATWTPVALQGEYLIDETLLVRGRPRDGRPGFEILVPFLLADGTAFIVDRGWVPVGETQAEVPDFLPMPMAGPQTVIARLKAGEPSVPGRSAPPGQVATIELPLIATLVEEPVYTGAYGVLAAEPESTVSAAPALAERPEPDPGPHLSYAVQWILFALFAAAALIWGIWNERRARRDEAEALATGIPVRVRQKRARVGDADSAEEDALLDR